ncbi:MAG: immunoglobulin domain-containing protein [Lachnospiraceae bacterium]|nr:immunoglobulin domain-containing protein [Lachnospiraceae bacterium]
MNKRIRHFAALLAAFVMAFGLAASTGLTGDVAVAANYTEIYDDITIESGGLYSIPDGVSDITITINTMEEVTIAGAGIDIDEDGQITSEANDNVVIDASNEDYGGVNLTLENLYLSNTSSANLIDFTGDGNVLTISGICVLDHVLGGGGTYAELHVDTDTELTIDGDGILYMYKDTGGAGIGGDRGEMNGDITFAMEDGYGCGQAFIKGTRQGAVIGAGASASSSTDAPGEVIFESGTYNLIGVARGAVIGGSGGSEAGSSGTTVRINGGLININTDYSGASVGGGYDSGNDASGGTMYVTGGSLRVYIDSNAANNATTGWQGKVFEEGVNDASITAQRLNEDGEEVHWLWLDTSLLSSFGSDEPETYTVNVDGELFYQGWIYEYYFVQEALDKSEQYTITSTPSNWVTMSDDNQDDNLYLWVTTGMGTDEDGERMGTEATHAVELNGYTFNFAWDDSEYAFERTTYIVTNSLTNLTTSNDAVTAEQGTAYTATLTPSEGFTLPDSISVVVTDTLDNEVDALDTESYTYDSLTGEIIIPAESVTGDIEITAVGVEETEGPVIITQPQDYSGVIGDTAVFTVEAAGSGLTYQWQYLSPGANTWKDSSGATTTLRSVEITAARDGQQYRCVVTDENGNSVTSDTATLIVLNVYDVDTTGLTNISLSEDSAATAVEAEEYSATLVADDGYTLPDTVTVTVGGTELTADEDYSYDAESGLLTISADAVTGTIAITAAGVEELAIITQPADYTGTVGDTAVFEVEATGSGLTYQWQYSSNGGTNWHDSGMTGADTAAVSVPVTSARDGQQYRCVVTDGNGDSVTSDAATLSLPADAFSITMQPEDYMGLAGSNASFTVEADGTDLSYQWQYSSNGGMTWHDSGMTGADTAMLSVTLTESRDGQQYRCVVTDGEGSSVTSDAATLSLSSAASIVITSQPSDYMGAAGDTAMFTVEATGNGLTYQWQYSSNGGTTWHDSGMDGADTATVSVPITSVRDGQQYHCVIMDEEGGVVASDAAALTAE